MTLEPRRFGLEDAARLAGAHGRLAEAILAAPFDGVVTAVHRAVGEWATGPVVEMVDVSSLEVVLDVDEVDIHLNPKIGPDWMLRGTQKRFNWMMGALG